MTAPVAIIAFNRPDLTGRVFERVRAARPSTLLLIADGPRDSVPADAERCAAVRGIFDQVDWTCEVHRKFEPRNLGCGPAVSQGLDWVFSTVEQAILLEDDCVPDPSFFPFCTELLERFAGDERIFQISGTNWDAPSAPYGRCSYGFNTFSPVWGWASWSRAWRHYDYRMRSWPEARSERLRGYPGGRRFQNVMRRQWDRAHGGEGTWDHQWQFTIFDSGGLAISPRVNLVTNIGFGPEIATQTTGDATTERLAGDVAQIPSEAIEFPLRHPPRVEHNSEIEAHFARTMLRHSGPAVELLRRLLPSHRARRALKRLLLRLRRQAPESVAAGD